MIVFKVGNRRPDWNASTTLNNRYSLAEVLSAVIKEIRRGNREEAVFWAHQMCSGGPEAIEFLWESLTICAMEDVGLADPNAINTVMNAKRFFFELPSGYVARDLTVAFATAFLADRPKSRLIDEMLFDMMQALDENEPTREIPDYALDHHTKRGRDLGRGELFFFQEAAKLHNEDHWLRSHHVYRDRIMQRLTKKG